MQIHLIDLKLKRNANSNLMNVLYTSTICMISLMTATSGFSTVVQAANFDAPRVATSPVAMEDTVFRKAASDQQKFPSLLGSYEPPPNIGGPKRTGGSGGR